MKKLVSVCITICMLLGMCSLSSFAAIYAKGTYVELINLNGGLLPDNIKAIGSNEFNIAVTASAKTGAELNTGTTTITADNVDNLVTFKRGTTTITFKNDLAAYYNVSGTISGTTADIVFFSKAANAKTVYKVTEALDTSTFDTAKLEPVIPAEKYSLSSESLSVSGIKFSAKLSSVTIGVRFFGNTYENAVSSNIARVQAYVLRNGNGNLTQVLTYSATNSITDLMPGDEIQLVASLKNPEKDGAFYGFYCWVDGSGNVLGTFNRINYTVEGKDVAFYATFVELKNRVTIYDSCGANGRMEVVPQVGIFDGETQISALEGRDVSLRIIPDAGYDLAHLWIDGRTDVFTEQPEKVVTDEPGVYQFTFSSIACDHSIEAVFQPEEISLCVPHIFSEWKTVVQANCQTTGLERRTCENCGLTQTRSTANTMHQWETVSSPKSVEGIAHNVQMCALCGETKGGIDSGVSSIADGQFDAGTYWLITSENELVLLGKGQTDAYASAADVPWKAYKSRIRTVTIGHNIRSIGAYVLDSCPNLTDIAYIGFEEEWEKVSIDAHNNAFLSASLSFVHPKIYAQNVSAGNVAGRKVRVSVLFENNPGIISTLLNVNYDTSKLRLVDVRNGVMMQSLEEEFSQQAFYTGKDLSAVPYTSFWCVDNMPASFWQEAGHLTGYPYDGVVLTYTFEILDGAQSGLTPIEITYDDASTFDCNLEYVQFETVSGSVNLIDCMPGDANDDNRISLMDTALISRYIAGGYDVTIDEINADVNRDNIIDLKDIILIKRYLVGGWGTVLY